MRERRRKFTPEFKDEAVKMAIESSRPIAEVAARIEACPYMCWTAAEIVIVALIALSAVVAGYESIRRLLTPQPIANPGANTPGPRSP